MVTAKHTGGRYRDHTQQGSCRNVQKGGPMDRKQDIPVYLTGCGFANHRTDDICIKMLDVRLSYQRIRICAQDLTSPAQDCTHQSFASQAIFNNVQCDDCEAHH